MWVAICKRRRVEYSRVQIESERRTAEEVPQNRKSGRAFRTTTPRHKSPQDEKRAHGSRGGLLRQQPRAGLKQPHHLDLNWPQPRRGPVKEAPLLHEQFTAEVAHHKTSGSQIPRNHPGSKKAHPLAGNENPPNRFIIINLHSRVECDPTLPTVPLDQAP